jgi:hypothetical protein
MLQMLLYALLVFGLGVAVIRRPSAALAGIFCLFGLKQWAQGTMVFFVQHGALPNLCMGLLLLLGLTVKLLRGQRVFSPYPAVGWRTLLLFAYAALTLLWTPDQGRSADLLLQALPYLATVIVLAPLLIGDREDLRPVAMTLLVFGGLLALLILLQVQWFNRKIILAGTSWADEGGNPLAVAQLGGYLVLAAMLLHFRNLRLTGWILRLALAALGLMLIAKTGSRGQLMGLLLVLFLFVPMRKRMDHPGKLVILGMTLGVLVTLALWLQSSFTTEVATGQRWTPDKMLTDMGGRFDNLGILLGIWSTGPLSTLIFGLGNSASYAIKALGIYPHFVPGEVLAEEGLPGILLYVSILVACLGNLRRTYARVIDDAEARAELALFGAILTYEFLLSLKQGNLLGNTFFFGMAIVIGRISLIYEDGAEHGRLAADQPVPWPTAAGDPNGKAETADSRAAP